MAAVPGTKSLAAKKSATIKTALQGAFLLPVVYASPRPAHVMLAASLDGTES
jgi:hypothetical protein